MLKALKCIKEGRSTGIYGCLDKFKINFSDPCVCNKSPQKNVNKTLHFVNFFIFVKLTLHLIKIYLIMKPKMNHSELRRKRIKNLAIWTGLWTVSVATVSFGSEFLWDYNLSITIIAIIVSTLIGAGMIWANITYLMALDELLRKIQMDAMGIALGVALVGGISYSMLDTTNVISQDAEISYLIILIGLSYMAAVLIGNARYK